MFNALKFCQGSVAKKDFLPALTHFVIEHGRVRGYNGVIALCSPIPFDIACKPRADKLIKAIAACKDTVQLSLTPTGRLAVKSGKARVYVDCVEGDTAHAMPEGAFFQLNGEALLEGLKAVAPFIGDDASRRWANGVLVENQSVFATNNITLVQYWVGFNLPRSLVIPRDAVKEMLRIGEAPTSAQLAQNSITFHYENDRWLRTQLYDSAAWPNLASILDTPSSQGAIEETWKEALETIKPFVDKLGRVLFQQQRIATHDSDSEGAQFDMPELIGVDGIYNIDMLELIIGVAKTIDWSTYPRPCLFQGGKLRGAIIGMRP
jgi:DNA polymerase III sliding clamp (beta) subunit (PCNA family)